MNQYTPQGKKGEVKEKIQHLRNLDARDFEIWQFFELRADKIKASLWTTATWLVTLKGALLAFILSERLIQISHAGVELRPVSSLLVTVLSGLGLAFTVLTWAMVGDIITHIRHNWQRASAAKGDYDAVLRRGRIYILSPLLALEGFFAVAFGTLLWWAFHGTYVDWIVIGFVALTVVGTLLYKLNFLAERPVPDKSASEDSNQLDRPRSVATKGEPMDENAYKLKDKDYLEIWKYCEEVGGRDKDRMVTISTWLLAFSLAILAYIFIYGFTFDAGIIKTVKTMRVIIASLGGIVICSAAAYLIYAYGAYANRYWFMADWVKRNKLEGLSEFHDADKFIDAINLNTEVNVFDRFAQNRFKKIFYPKEPTTGLLGVFNVLLSLDMFLLLIFLVLIPLAVLLI